MSVEQAIAAHKAAISIDEANFTDDGVPLDEAAALQSGIVEISAYKTLVRVQCQTPAEAQAKLDYFLTGSVGIRSPLIDCLLADEYSGEPDDMTAMLRVFLRSLTVVPAEAGGEHVV